MFVTNLQELVNVTLSQHKFSLQELHPLEDPKRLSSSLKG